MKIRQGFVSNSSSSSFVALVLKEEFKKIEDSLGILDASVFRAIRVTDKKFLGQDCVVFVFADGGYSTLEYIEDEIIMKHAEQVALERCENLSENFKEDIEDLKWNSECNCKAKILELSGSSDTCFVHMKDF